MDRRERDESGYGWKLICRDQYRYRGRYIEPDMHVYIKRGREKSDDTRQTKTHIDIESEMEVEIEMKIEMVIALET
jgi:hypothetical protein